MSAILELAFIFRCTFLIFFPQYSFVHWIIWSARKNIQKSKSQVQTFVSNEKSIWHKKCLLLGSQVLCNFSYMFQMSVLLNKENKFI